MGFKFEELKVWNEAVDSEALNIAEGSTGQSNKEFAGFLAIALRSGIECVTCIHLTVRRKLIDRETFELHYEKLQQLIKGIQALRKAIISKN